MKKLCGCACLLLVLSGCSKAPTVPACDAPPTIKMVTDTVNLALLKDASSDDEVSFSYDLTEITTVSTDKALNVRHCAGKLAVNIKDDSINDTLYTPLQYSVGLSADTKQVYVQVDEN